MEGIIRLGARRKTGPGKIGVRIARYGICRRATGGGKGMEGVIDY